MVEKCANPECSEPFDCRQGRLYFRLMQPVDGSPPTNSHGVEHHWLCGSCSKTYSFEHRAGFDVVVTPRAKENNPMWQVKNAALKVSDFFLCSLLVLGLLTAGSIPGLSQDKPKPETIQAAAMGTSTQLGKVTQVKLIINEYSTEEDRQILIEAFEKGKNQGLVNALEKMRAVGRIAIEGTLGYDVSYARSIQTPTGRKIRFITNRVLRFGETYYSTRTVDYNLTGGEIDLNEQDQSKSTGVLYPAAKLRLDKDKQLSLDLNMNPWKLVNILSGR